jgi:hypothetical protein
LILAFIAILVGVFAVATGRGGELAYEQADHAPLDLGPISATDVALLRPPTALWGYNMQVTDEALDRIARTLRDRDVEIAYLQRQLADVGHPQWTEQARPDPWFPPEPPTAEAQTAEPQEPEPQAAVTQELDAQAPSPEQTQEAQESQETEEQGW